jgi:hypothetical protein
MTRVDVRHVEGMVRMEEEQKERKSKAAIKYSEAESGAQA